MKYAIRKLGVFLLANLILLGSIQPQSSGISYVYDELGRLIAVIDPSSDTAIYAYDAVGNLLSITRRSSSQVSIIKFTPSSGPVGTVVTIYGTGFSTTPSSNTVQFNGVTATVTSSTVTKIVTSVPTGATTGLISVTTPTGSATSSTAFTVGSKAPTITSFTPTIGTIGTAVTITGTNFDTTTTNNKVKFNIINSSVTSSTATSISTSVPNSGSGPIAVTTPYGKAASSADFFIPPSPYAAADIAVTDRMNIGDSKTETISTSGKKALVLFSGTVGQKVSLKLTSVTINSSYISIYSPDGSTLAFPTFVTSSNGGFVDTKSLPATGTYTILINPSGTYTGSMVLNLYNVVDLSNTITIGGSAVTLSVTTPGQNAKVTFSGTAGQRVSLNLTNSSVATSYVSIISPDTTWLALPQSITYNGFVDTRTLPTTGTYTIFFDPSGANTGNITLTLYNVPADVSGTITPGGSAVTVTITTPGQNGTLTFSGTTGQRISMNKSGNTISGGNITIKKPDSTTLLTTSISNGFIDTTTLPSTGTYSIFIDPLDASTGSITLTLYDVPADLSGTITPGGSAVTMTFTTPGQNGTLTFSGTAGQKVSLTTSSSLTPSYAWVYIRQPDGSTIGSTSTDGTFIDALTLSVTGAYSIFVDPQVNTTGSVTLTLYNVVDFNGTTTINGSSVAVSLTTPGQNGYVTFSGTTGQQVTVHVTGNTITWVGVFLKKPDGSTLTSTWSGNASFNLTTQTLPVDGTYTIFIDASGNRTGSLNVSVTSP